MNITEKITLDNLTQDSVSVLRQKFIIVDGTEMQVGGNIRNAFMNTAQERAYLKETLSDEYYNAIIAVWGEEPTAE